MAGYIRGVSHPSSGVSVSIRDKRNASLDRGNKNSRIKNNNTDDSYGRNGTKSQNIKASRVYVFGDADLNDEDDENVEFEMRSRHKRGFTFVSEKEQAPEYFEKEISEGETLQAIALKYACQVSEIKRLNNLIQDQEFYALKVIKVPMTQYGILSEQFSNQSIISKQSRKTASLMDCSPDYAETISKQYEENDSQHDFSDPETQIKILRTLSIRDGVSAPDEEAEKFLQKKDEDLKKLKQNSQQHKESLTEVISILTNKNIEPLQTSKPTIKLNGADCGISWWSILIFVIVIAIIIPVVALIYFFILDSKHTD